jgi:hypothetical protein
MVREWRTVRFALEPDLIRDVLEKFDQFGEAFWRATRSLGPPVKLESVLYDLMRNPRQASGSSQVLPFLNRACFA